jgi:hypothetical protein
MLCALYADTLPIRFAILASGFIPRDVELSQRFDAMPAQAIALPTLHIIGDTDTWVTPDRSHALVAKFAQAVVVSHPGGHVLPVSKELTSKYHDWLAQFCG